MGIRALNAEILSELRDVTKKKSIRQKDIVEWSTTPVTAEEHEKLAYLPKLGVHVAYKDK